MEYLLINVLYDIHIVALFEHSVNGGWSHWTRYHRCSVSCGGGTKTRSRSCTHPKPAHGGNDCVGDREESKQCNEHACPGNCYVHWFYTLGFFVRSIIITQVFILLYEQIVFIPKLWDLITYQTPMLMNKPCDNDIHVFQNITTCVYPLFLR